MADTDRPGDPHGGDAGGQTQIRTFLIAAAVQAPITNPLTTHAVSDRAQNVQVHPQWGLMLSLIWVQ